MTDLSSLRERVIAADGPDRELDAAVWWALEKSVANKAFFTGAMGLPRSADEMPDAFASLPRGLGREGVIVLSPKLTASLDAVVALVERMLPEWQIISITMGWRGPGKLHDHLPEEWRKRYARAQLEVAAVAQIRRSENSYVQANGEAKTPALALLAALLSALRHERRETP